PCLSSVAGVLFDGLGRIARRKFMRYISPRDAGAVHFRGLDNADLSGIVVTHIETLGILAASRYPLNGLVVGHRLSPFIADDTGPGSRTFACSRSFGLGCRSPLAYRWRDRPRREN